MQAHGGLCPRCMVATGYIEDGADDPKSRSHHNEVRLSPGSPPGRKTSSWSAELRPSPGKKEEVAALECIDCWGWGLLRGGAWGREGGLIGALTHPVVVACGRGSGRWWWRLVATARRGIGRRCAQVEVVAMGAGRGGGGERGNQLGYVRPRRARSSRPAVLLFAAAAVSSKCHFCVPAG